MVCSEWLTATIRAPRGAMQQYLRLSLENRLSPPFHKEQAHFTFPQNSFFALTRKKYISTTYQANLPEPESPLEEEKTFWRTLRSDLHEAEVLSGFLLQRCHPLWRRGFGQRCGRCSWCWQGVQRSVESWACVSACEPVGLCQPHPRPRPLPQPRALCKTKVEERKETVKV